MSHFYIPIWLDLLCRFINIRLFGMICFTFQYGQIYYYLDDAFTVREYVFYISIWLDLLWEDIYKSVHISYVLHSNMVRFIIKDNTIGNFYIFTFTFQYGQIYYMPQFSINFRCSGFYIPIWLDLLYIYQLFLFLQKIILHSNMVRFIIFQKHMLEILIYFFTFQYGQIYYCKTT